jgi:hypothetical protein
MAISTDLTNPVPSLTTRRALIAGAFGAIAALAAQALGRPAPAQATDGDAIVVGGEYDAQSRTYLNNNVNAATVIEAGSITGAAVIGHSGSGEGVIGSSSTGMAITATSGAIDRPASRGWSTGNSTGVLGHSGAAAPPAAKTKTGVYGVANQDTGAHGVWGESAAGTGVFGDSTSGYGVAGSSDSNIGVYGDSSSNIGLYGTTFASDQSASLGWNYGSGTGVLGHSGGGEPPAAKPKTGVFGHASQDSSSRGLWGESPAGIGVYGGTSSGYAGYFRGKVFTNRWYELEETVTPTAPPANKARLFLRDVDGKTQLCVRFNTGSVKLLASE